MKTKYALYAFVLVCLAQLAAVGSHIRSYEDLLANGTEFRFRTEPVDPYDIFRGRYVEIRLKDSFVEVPNSPTTRFGYGEKAWAKIGVDGEGFARFDSLSKEPLGGDELLVEVQGSDLHSGGPEDTEPVSRLRLATQFDRFYMNERAAPRAESELRKRAWKNTWVTVRIKEGRGLIEEVYVDGAPLGRWLAENP